MWCRSDWLLDGSPLLLSLQWGCLGGRRPAFPFSQPVHLSGQTQLPVIGVCRPSTLFGSAQLISLLRRAQQLHKIHLLPSDPSQPTPPRRHGAVTTATRWTVSCPHLFQKDTCDRLLLHHSYSDGEWCSFYQFASLTTAELKEIMYADERHRFI